MPDHIIRRCHRSAFTLAELLGACVCVGLLFSAVAVPSLRSVANSSRHEQCLQRLQAIGQASEVYSATDMAESSIPVHPKQFDYRIEDPVGAYDWGGKSGVGWPDYAGGGNDLRYSRYGTFAGFGPATKPLNQILYTQGFRDNTSGNLSSSERWAGALADTQLPLDAYRCPADDGPPLAAHCRDWVDHPARSSFDHFGTSYVANTYSNSISYYTVFSNSPYLRKKSNVPNPARTIHYQENIGRWAWAAKREPNGCDYCCVEGVDPGPTKAIRGWHGRDWTYNQAHVDGHAEKRQMYFDGTEDANNFALHYRLEELSAYPAPNCCQRDDETCAAPSEDYGPYGCAMVRGDGWQIDTMPAPFICTGRSTYGYRPSYEGCVAPPGNTAGNEGASYGIR